jgi:DNA-binding transcriptional MerR regulator/methylmalonyl-CoA mutase cobalamin-binding subunit
MSSDGLNATPRHPIRIVTERTGLSPDVLRAWERRHGVVTPARSEGGQRLYSDADVRRLSQLVQATRAGRSVSQVASVPPEELSRLLAEDADRGRARSTTAAAYRALALKAVHDLAPRRLEAELRRALLTLGVPAFLEDVLVPLMTGIGEEWHAGRISIAHEHAASAAAGQVLTWLVGELPVSKDAPHVLLAAPSGERHSLGAMIAAVVAALDGWRVTWLGADLPANQIADAAVRVGANLVGLSLVALEVSAASAAVARVRGHLPTDIPLIVGGGTASAMPRRDDVWAARDLGHWRSLLKVNVPLQAVPR